MTEAIQKKYFTRRFEEAEEKNAETPFLRVKKESLDPRLRGDDSKNLCAHRVFMAAFA